MYPVMLIKLQKTTLGSTSVNQAQESEATLGIGSHNLDNCRFKKDIDKLSSFGESLPA